MAIEQHYEIEFDNRIFDNVMEAVNAAMQMSIGRREVNLSTKVKVYSSVKFSSSNDYKKTTLQIIDVPSGITKRLLENPSAQSPISQRFSDPSVPSFKPCFNCGRK
jgi:hypothetical protein